MTEGPARGIWSRLAFGSVLFCVDCAAMPRGQCCLQEHSSEMDATLISWPWNITTTTLLAYRFGGSLAMGGRPASSLLLLGSRVELYTLRHQCHAALHMMSSPTGASWPLRDCQGQHSISQSLRPLDWCLAREHCRRHVDIAFRILVIVVVLYLVSVSLSPFPPALCA